MKDHIVIAMLVGGLLVFAWGNNGFLKNIFPHPHITPGHVALITVPKCLMVLDKADVVRLLIFPLTDNNFFTLLAQVTRMVQKQNTG